MQELGLNQTNLALRCDETAQGLFPNDQQPVITRVRIAKILMHCKAKAGKSAARTISPQELLVLSSALNVSQEWLSGQEDNRDLVLWDPLADPARARQIIHLMNEYEDSSNEVLIWAEFLICSLETPEFMHKHHEALFAGLDLIGAPEEKRRVVELFDRIGNARRRRFFDSKPRGRRMVEIMFTSDLERIGLGTEEYGGISKTLRRRCLENAVELLSDPSLTIELVIADDEDCKQIRIALRDYDSVSVCDDRFVQWRYHSGRVAWSEHPAHTLRYRGMLKELQVRGSSRSGADAADFIKALVRTIR